MSPAQESNYCPNCGTPNRPSARFCKKCQTELSPAAATAAQASPVVAAGPAPEPVSSPMSAQAPVQPEPGNGMAAPAPNQAVFAPLPAGELLFSELTRFEVGEPITTQANLNVYWAAGAACPQCGFARGSAHERFCANCGSELPAEPRNVMGRFLIKERLDRAGDEVFGGQRFLKGLSNEGMIHIYDHFRFAPYGPPRVYLVCDKEEAEPQTLASQRGNVTEPQVLGWALSLAKALAYLHANDISHDGIALNNIRLVNGGAKFANLVNARKLTYKQPREKEEIWSAEVRKLADELGGMLAHVQLSAPAAALFQRARAQDPNVRFASAGDFAAEIEKTLKRTTHPANVTLLAGGVSNVGKVRELNEDSMLQLEWKQVRQSVSEPMGLYVVADGMGGAANGEVASALAIRSISEAIARDVVMPALAKGGLGDENYEALARKAGEHANQVVYELKRAQHSDMGTTLVYALVLGSMAYVGNVGDSRAYLISRDAIKQISVDHSLVQRLVAAGQIKPEEARNHPQRNVIYRVLGDKPQVEIDMFTQPLEPGQSILLCCDGLSGELLDSEIQQIVTAAPDPQAASEALIKAANERGAHDNITALVVQLHESR